MANRVKVELWASLKRFTDGNESVEIEAENIGALFDGLVRFYPQLKPVIDAGVAVSVNGAIETNHHTKIHTQDEIFLIQKLKGG